MKHADRDDLLIIGMGLNALLESVRQTEAWWRVHGDGAALRRTRLLARVILATRQAQLSEHAAAANDRIKMAAAERSGELLRKIKEFFSL